MTDIDYFRSRLLDERDALRNLQGTREASSATVELDQANMGRLSRMDALQQQAMAQRTGQQAAQRLRRIEAALRRCDDGRYGVCLDCDEPIGERRLDFDPAAALCIACAEARES